MTAPKSCAFSCRTFSRISSMYSLIFSFSVSVVGVAAACPLFFCASGFTWAKSTGHEANSAQRRTQTLIRIFIFIPSLDKIEELDQLHTAEPHNSSQHLVVLKITG